MVKQMKPAIDRVVETAFSLFSNHQKYGDIEMSAMKILVIDDALFTRKVYCKLLMDSFEVIEASNGEEGLRLCAKLHPDLVICDLLMPGLNGFQFLKEYTTWEDRAPVIICSSDVQEETREKCFELGADEFIIKPCLTDTKAFLETVLRSLELREAPK